MFLFVRRNKYPEIFFGSLLSLFVFAACPLLFVFGCFLLVDFSFLLGMVNVFVSGDFFLCCKGEATQRLLEQLLLFEWAF
jgi:hypothetical protein